MIQRQTSRSNSFERGQPLTLNRSSEELPDISKNSLSGLTPAIHLGSTRKLNNVYGDEETLFKPKPWRSPRFITYTNQTPLDAQDYNLGKTSQRNTIDHVERSINTDFDPQRSSRTSFTKNIKGRTSFTLRGMDLINPPKSLFRMIHLENLSMSPEREACLDFKLTSLPKEIGNLHNLRLLALDTNELKELPAEISLLSQLEILTLSNNCLASLPDGFSKLANMRSLHLANNRFTEFPTEICGLSNITFLDMTDNSLRKIPKEIELISPTLQTLFLYLNDLEKLPDSFCKLSRLTTLWLGKNRLRSLPSQFGNLSGLDWGINTCSSNIDDNPLARPPLAVCQQGILAIKEYFERESIRPVVKEKLKLEHKEKHIESQVEE